MNSFFTGRRNVQEGQTKQKEKGDQRARIYHFITQTPHHAAVVSLVAPWLVLLADAGGY